MLGSLRNPLRYVPLSYVCGILDPYGGLRFVVDRDPTFGAHVRCDEMLFVVPGLRVREPVPWEQITMLIASVEHHIAEWARSRNDPETLQQTPIKMYLLRCTENPSFKRSMNTDAVVMG